MSTTVRDVMTTSVIAVRGDTSFKEMAAMLGSSRVSGFPGHRPGRQGHRRRV